MLDTQFFNSFSFNLYTFSKFNTNDYTKGQGVRKHFIGRIMKGRGKFVTADGAIILNEGDVFYIPKHAQYRSFWYPENNEELSFYSFGFELFPLKENDGYKLQKIECDKSEIELLEELCKDITVSLQSIGMLYTFLGNVSDKMKSNETGFGDKTVFKALDYMRSNTDYSIKDVADYCGLSESGLYAMFRRKYGKTPIKIKHGIVAKKAADLLKTTDISIEEICNRLNFSSSAYFRKIIKEETGKTPSEIRKNSIKKRV